ncbi:MAG: polysaccharide biosynthesis/export family protein [Candidatus Sulfotelmatobacter sp.]|jgi:polysaccharide export outer membrane protein
MVRRIGLWTGTLAVAIACLGLAQAQEVSSANTAHVVATAEESTAAGTGSPAPVAASTPRLQARDTRYHLCAGDSFDVSFELSPEFNQTVTVQPDGYVTLRSVGDVMVENQTVPQLTQTLREAYGKILNDPLIVVVLKDFQKPFFVADGQVGHPGRYDMRGNVTLAEAIAVAGGFTEAAKHSQVRLYRRVDDQWMFAKVYNLKDMEKKGDLHEDPLLHPGDMLFVPKNTFSKIKPFIPYTGVSAGAVMASP